MSLRMLTILYLVFPFSLSSMTLFSIQGKGLIALCFSSRLAGSKSIDCAFYFGNYNILENSWLSIIG